MPFSPRTRFLLSTAPSAGCAWVLVFVVSVGLFAGCRGWVSRGAKQAQTTITAPGGVSVGSTAPGNPSTPASSSIREETTWVPITQMTGLETNPVKPSEPQAIQQVPAGFVQKKVVEVKTTTGAAYKDTSAEIRAKGEATEAAWSKVQYFGMALLVLSAATLIPYIRVAIGGGKSITVVLGAAGAVLLLAPGLLQGNEQLIIGILAVGGVVYWLSVRSSYKEGRQDAASSSTNNQPK